ncbi:MAG: lipase family alpha/beta hydrolase [Solimonas sp.]
MSKERRHRRFGLAAALLAVCTCAVQAAHAADPPVPPNGRTVVLLHGLARSASSMQRMERALQAQGYRICNLDYPSREHTVEELAARYVAPAVAACRQGSDAPVDFVTHSMGGIIVRELAHSGAVRDIGRVVMLGPPNQGSEVVDALGGWSLFRWINGPAGAELGTAADALPNRLGAPAFEVGVIGGTRSINLILSAIIPGDDDGKVSVQRVQLAGARDFVLVGASHPFLMNDREAIAQTLRFLEAGCFAHTGQQDASVSPTCIAIPQSARS